MVVSRQETACFIFYQTKFNVFIHLGVENFLLFKVHLILVYAVFLTKKTIPVKDKLSIMYVCHATFPLRRWLKLT